METIVKARKIGGSIGVLIPKQVIDKEGISAEDTLKIKVERNDNLNSLWGKFKDIKKSTDQIMREIDEGEIDG